MSKLTAWLTPRRRKYIYRLATAGLAIAVAYGLLSEEEVRIWGTFLGTALVTTLADANTSTDSGDSA